MSDQIASIVSYSTNGQVTAANLNDHVNKAKLVVGAVTEQTPFSGTPGASDLLLIAQGINLRKITWAELCASMQPIGITSRSSIQASSLDATGNLLVGGTSTLNDNVAIATDKNLSVGGSTTISKGLTVNDAAAGNAMIVKGSGDANLLVINHPSYADKVGIGTATPSEKLEVTGNIKTSANAIVGGNATVAGTLTVTGATTLGALTVSSLSGVGAAVAKAKTVDESVSATTLQDDDDLQFPIGANEKWAFEINLIHRGVASGTSIGFSGPSGMTELVAMGYLVQENGNIKSPLLLFAAASDSKQFDSSNSTTGNGNCIRITGYVLNSTTAGTFKLRWCAFSTGTHVVAKGSTLRATRIA